MITKTISNRDNNRRKPTLNIAVFFAVIAASMIIGGGVQAAGDTVLWRGLKWGMSGESIVAELKTQGVNVSLDAELNMLDCADTWNNREAHVILDLDDNKLSRITVVSTFQTKEDAETFHGKVEKEYIGKFGKPRSAGDAADRWDSKDTSMTLMLGVGEEEPTVTIVYEPIEKAPDTGPNNYYKVIGVESWDVLYIREKGNPYAESVGSIPCDGKCVLFLNATMRYKSRIWYKIKYNGIEGWVNSRFLSKDTTGECK